MAKYYIATANFRNIIDAPNIDLAISRSVQKLVDTSMSHAPLIATSERGFFGRDMVLTPIIPVMKLLKVDLPDDRMLAKFIAKCYGTTPNKMNQTELNWLLNGKWEE